MKKTEEFKNIFDTAETINLKKVIGGGDGPIDPDKIPRPKIPPKKPKK